MVTLWKATEYEHTSSVDEPAYVNKWKHKTKSNDSLSVSLVIVQKKKLLSIPFNCHDIINKLYSVDIFQAYSSADTSDEKVNSHNSKKRKAKGEKEVHRQQKKRWLDIL